MRLPVRSWQLLAAMVAVASASGTARAQVIEDPPSPGSFALRPELAGAHPRLHFTSSDIPALRAKGKGDAQFFVERMKAAFGGYVGKPVNIDAPWKGYLYGLWGQLAMAMLYIVEEDPAYAETAKSWALHFARDPGFPAQTDDLIPQEITTGLALTYDILYDQLTADERQDIRAKLAAIIDAQYDEFFEGQYWTQDFQNNHMHNRISGLGHAAIAMLGDDPNLDVQKHADLAYHAYQQVEAWAPPDGSHHEGPGYWDYGYHWVTRISQLFEHTTGLAPSNAEHERNAPYFRLYTLTPGMLNTFGFADTSGYGPASNLEAILPAVARFQDARLHGFFQDQMDRNPDGFYQQTAWGLLWYDAAVPVDSYESLPLGKVWTDLDAISVRAGWGEGDVGVFFLCGPPGGHHMQQIRAGDYVNVAHDHPDQNHFMIWAHGEMLADDDGYPKSPDTKLTASHNTIVVDGQGGPEEGSGWYQPFPYEQTAFLRDVLISGSTAYAAGDAGRLYTHADRFVRHFVFVEGEYVMIIDDLQAEGAQDREFDWRLHNDGDWTELGALEHEVSKGDAGLHVRLLAPAASNATSSYFPAQGTAKPGLSIKTSATVTQFMAVLTPQSNGSPSFPAAVRDATHGWAIRAEPAGSTDLYAVASGTEPVSVDDLEARGAAAVVRRMGGSLTMTALARGRALSLEGETIVQSDRDANLTWRPTSTGGRLEVEAPYKESGGDAIVHVGTLVGSANYCVSIDGYGAGKVTADASGVASLSIDITSGHTVLFEQAGSGTTCPTDPIPDGGTGGTGGSAGSGGSGGSGGSSGGGGSVDGGAGNAGVGGSAGAGPNASSSGSSDDGCGCSVPGTSSRAASTGAGIALLLLGAALLRRRRGIPRPVALAVAPIVLTACSALLDKERNQCETNADCEGFDAVCNTELHVCAASGTNGDGGTCELASPPLPPSISSAGDTFSFTVVLVDNDYGDGLDGQPATVDVLGYDLDGVCSTDTHDRSCAPFEWAGGTVEDFEGGRDNGIARIVFNSSSYIGDRPISAQNVSEAIRSGTIPPVGIVRIKDYAGKPQDDRLEVGWFVP
ncbi:MAG: DUF4962 domain-containing protein, partial [Myxococcota bacterium]